MGKATLTELAGFDKNGQLKRQKIVILNIYKCKKKLKIQAVVTGLRLKKLTKNVQNFVFEKYAVSLIFACVIAYRYRFLGV
jgi:hypothetical protein